MSDFLIELNQTKINMGEIMNETGRSVEDKELVIFGAQKAIEFLKTVGNNPFEILSLTQNFTKQELEDSYMKFALTLHPDQLEMSEASSDLIHDAMEVYPKVVRAYTELIKIMEKREKLLNNRMNPHQKGEFIDSEA